MIFALFAVAIAAAFFVSSMILLNYGRHLGLRYLQWQKDAGNMAGLTTVDSRRKRDRFLVSLALDHHGPDHSRDLVGERDSSNLRRPPRQQSREPWPMFGAVDLGIADDGQRTGHEQAAQIAVTLFADTAEPVLAAAGVLLRREANPGREVAP